MWRNDDWRGVLRATELQRTKVHEVLAGKAVSDRRVGYSLTMLSIACHHEAAIGLLMERKLDTSAFALVRVAAEAAIRGTWVHIRGGLEAVDAMIAGREEREIFPSFKKMIEEIDDGRNDPTLKTISLSWKNLCGLTHSGAQQFNMHRSSEGTLGSQFTDRQKAEALKMVSYSTTYLASLVALDVAGGRAVQEVLDNFSSVFNSDYPPS